MGLSKSVVNVDVGFLEQLVVPLQHVQLDAVVHFDCEWASVVSLIAAALLDLGILV